MPTIRDLAIEAATDMKLVCQKIKGDELELFCTGRTSRWLMHAHWDETTGEMGSIIMIPLVVPETRRPGIAEFFGLVNAQIQFGEFKIEDDGQCFFMADSEVLESGIPSKDLIRASFEECCKMMDQFFIGLSMVVYGGVNPRRAVLQTIKDGPESLLPKDCCD